MSTHTQDMLNTILCYVVELEEGDVTVDGDVVLSVERITDHKTRVEMENGKVFWFGKGNSTMRILV